MIIREQEKIGFVDKTREKGEKYRNKRKFRIISETK